MAGTHEPPRHADEQEFEFMVAQRHGKLAGSWAAELLGLIGQAAHDYALKFSRGAHHDGDLATKLETDLHGKATSQEIREKIAHLLAEARRQVRGERKGDGA